MPPIFTYPSTEKLKSRKLLKLLFAEGKHFLVFPVKVFYLEMKDLPDAPVKAGVGATTKNFKKAVDRNRIKRLLREHYRLNKLPLHEFLQIHNKQVIVFFLYINKELPTNELLAKKMPIVLQKLMHQLSETAPPIS